MNPDFFRTEKELIQYINSILDSSPPYLELEEWQKEDIRKILSQLNKNGQ